MPNVRLYESELTAQTCYVQLFESELTTPAFTSISLGAARAVDGLELVTIDATHVGAAPLDSGWTWTVQSDTSELTVLEPDGPQCVFTAPGTVAGATVVIGATASNGTTTSPLATITFSVYPHLLYISTADVWVPRTREYVTA